MRKQTSTFDRMHGDKPDAKKIEELKKKVRAVVPEVVKAVENRERLAARILLKELEGSKRRKRLMPMSKVSSEGARKRPLR